MKQLRSALRHKWTLQALQVTFDLKVCPLLLQYFYEGLEGNADMTMEQERGRIARIQTHLE